MPSKARGRTKDDRMVKVSLAYVAFLHDQLAVNQEKLKEILGSGAEVISGHSADELVGSLSKDSPYGRVNRLVKTVRGWGMELKQTRKGDLVQFEVGCPYAEYVHPRLSSEKPICPLGEYVLGEVRQIDRKAAMENCALTERGSRFAIRLAPVALEVKVNSGGAQAVPEVPAKSRRASSKS
jgi:hypothetical protein